MSSNPGAGPPKQTLLPETEGRGGGRQGGRGPAPGSAWVKFRATQVLGGQAVNIFSAKPTEQASRSVQDQETQAEEVEAQARQCGSLTWEAEDVPPPDFAVVTDELGPFHRAELCVFVKRRGEALKDVRVRGPRRHTVQEARKDGNELRRAAFHFSQDDLLITGVLARLKEIEAIEWRTEDLGEEDVSGESERRLPEFTTQTNVEKMREQRNEPQTLKEWIYEKKEEIHEDYRPMGPSWSKAGQVTATPRIPGIWYVHTRQKEDGRHVTWMFFNATTGKYYRELTDGGTWIQTGVPHNAVAHPVKTAHANVCVPTACGRKDDLAVILPELAKTGSILKHPLPFLDKPAALFLLVDGSRGSREAAEFCARRFHTFFMPRLSARATDLEDIELLAIVNESVESLDHALLESTARYAGCGFALALILGRRLVVSTLGDCRAVLSQAPPPEKGQLGTKSWQTRPLSGGRPLTGPADQIAALMQAVNRRLEQAGAPLDLDVAGSFRSTSASIESLNALASDTDRALTRVARAAHPFATLGLRPSDLAQNGVAAVRRAVRDFEAVASPSDLRDPGTRALAASADSRIRKAASVVETLLGVDPFATQLLAELFYVMDDEGGTPSQQRAAAALGVEPGCGDASVQAAIDRRYQALIMQLTVASPEVGDQGLRTIAEIAEIAARREKFWAPEDRGVNVTRGLGFRDLKRPRRLVGLELASYVMKLEQGASCLTLLTDGARGVSDEQIGKIASQHRCRPRAMSLRLVKTSQESKEAVGEAVGVICVNINVDDEIVAGIGAVDLSKQPDAKKRKIETAPPKEPGKPAKMRLAHILLKFAGASDSDAHARRSAPANRTQQDAEHELLEALEALQQNANPKTLGARFAQLAREKSDCKSALNTPHADLGWINPGQWGKEFDAAVAEMQVGTLSDIVVTQRGAHLIYRLA